MPDPHKPMPDAISPAIDATELPLRMAAELAGLPKRCSQRRCRHTKRCLAAGQPCLEEQAEHFEAAILAALAFQREHERRKSGPAHHADRHR